MDREARRTLNVVYSAKALKRLDEIWDWNAEHYGLDHADDYTSFLERRIDALEHEYERGIRVASRPEFRFVLIRRRSRRRGHLAVYRIKQNRIDILHIFHSAEDWQAKLAEEVPG
jgi:plasmid stabilization system protein ParE